MHERVASIVRGIKNLTPDAAAEGEIVGRYVIVTPINSLYATGEIFGPAGVGGKF